MCAHEEVIIFGMANLFINHSPYKYSSFALQKEMTIVSSNYFDEINTEIKKDVPGGTLSGEPPA